jgi:hypothetical protein
MEESSRLIAESRQLMSRAQAMEAKAWGASGAAGCDGQGPGLTP